MLANPVEYNTQRLPDSPNRGNGNPDCLYCRMDRGFAECGGLCCRRPIEFHDAGVSLEYLGNVSNREQSTDGITHRPAPAAFREESLARSCDGWQPESSRSRGEASPH